MRSGWARAWFVVCAATVLGSGASAVGIEFVRVGDPGNAADPDPTTELCGAYESACGAVATSFWIGRFEVTNAQYAAFLNAVAASDPNDLYNTTMAAPPGGITRSGSPGSYSYAVIAGRANKPVNFVSWNDAIRFANWLHNGQPTGPQDVDTTEAGSYTGFAPETRDADATFVLPTENEWYKAAYYSAGGYFDFPVGSNAQTLCSAPSVTPNTANCANAIADTTDIGSYLMSAGPNGTFDQGGNAWEWNETDIFGDTGARGIRGGGWSSPPSDLSRIGKSDIVPFIEDGSLGFRVAVAPEPGRHALLAAAVLLLALLRHGRRGARARPGG
jgi:formylglycine-generating enzyme required for sulfatase activity